MNKEFILSNLPDGYAHLAPGEYMPEMSYYIFIYQEISVDKLKNIDNWLKYARTAIGEKRNKDTMSIFIKAAPAPVVPPAPKYQFKQITDINIGDIFAYWDSGEPVIINVNRYTFSENDKKYIILGYGNNLVPFSWSPKTKQEMIAYLNSNKYVYITSIAPQIEKTLKLARKLLLDSKK